MRFLILGCNGMLGHVVAIYLQEQGHSVIGFARSESKVVQTICGDAQNLPLLKNIIELNKFNVVVNCIGILNQDAEFHKYEAVYMNALLPHYLAKITANMSTQVIHISTDCVFSGKKGSYIEEDFRDGESFYDRSKALGELVDNKNVTLRQSVVGPDLNPSGIGLLNWFMKQSGEVKGYTKAIWTGQTSLQLAKTIETVAVQKVYGLFHMVPESSITKYELLRLFNKYFREKLLTIIPVEGKIADKSLIRTNYSLEYRVPDYEKMVFELAAFMEKHKYLYPHYKL